MNLRRLAFVPAAIAALFVIPACGGAQPNKRVEAPEWNADGQAKCKVVRSKAEPLVVEWPSADRAKLEALTRQGIVAVKYDGCEMHVLGACKAKGTYRYVGTTLKHDSVRIKDADELYAKLPFGAANFESTLKNTGELDVSMSLVGRFAAEQPVIHETELTGACTGATHVISALIVGAFEFSAKAANNGKERGSVFDATAGSGSQYEKQVLTQDGDERSCASASASDSQPPSTCRALIRVEVLSLPEAEKRASEAHDAEVRELEKERASASTRKTVGYAVGGAGIGLVVLGGVLGLVANSKLNSVKDGGLASSTDIQNADDSAKSTATVAWISAVAGLVAVGAGGTLIYTAKSPNGLTGAHVEAASNGMRLVW